MTLRLIGNIQHGEKYVDKQGGDKWSNTDLGTLFKDDEKDEYVVKYLGQWCKVWPKKMGGEGYRQAKQAIDPQAPLDDDSGNIPF